MSPRSTDIAHRFAAAFEAGDLGGLLGCFTRDAVYHDLFYGAARGHDELRDLFARMYREGEDHRWTMTRVLRGPDRTVGEWDFAFTVRAPMRGHGCRLDFSGISVFDTTAGGSCRTYREYFDRGAALYALGITPEAVGRIIAARPSVQVGAAGTVGP